jgi:hypothetical protein
MTTTDTPGPEELDLDIEIQAGRRAPFTQIGDWVLLSGVSDRAVSLYCRLAMHVNAQRGDTDVWPALEVLAEFADFNKPESITPYMDELVVIGAVAVERVRYAGGLRARNRYTVHRAPTLDHAGPTSLAAYYRMCREHPEELAGWRTAQRTSIAAGVKVIAERRRLGVEYAPTDSPRRAIPDGPALVYVLEHPRLRAVKVGFSSGGKRPRRFGRHGWRWVSSTPFADGALALAVEQAVLRHIRKDLGLSHFLSAGQMHGMGGATETFRADLLSAEKLSALVADETRKAADAAKRAGAPSAGRAVTG